VSANFKLGRIPCRVLVRRMSDVRTSQTGEYGGVLCDPQKRKRLGERESRLGERKKSTVTRGDLVTSVTHDLELIFFFFSSSSSHAAKGSAIGGPQSSGYSDASTPNNNSYFNLMSCQYPATYDTPPPQTNPSTRFNHLNKHLVWPSHQRQNALPSPGSSHTPT
jgi:hypothetical protein